MDVNKKFDVTVAMVENGQDIQLTMKIVQQPDVPYADFNLTYHGLNTETAQPLKDAAAKFIGTKQGLGYVELCHLEAEVMGTLAQLGQDHMTKHGIGHGHGEGHGHNH